MTIIGNLTMNTSIKSMLLILLITLSMPVFGMMDRIKNYLYQLYERPAVYKAGVKAIDTGASSTSRFAT